MDHLIAANDNIDLAKIKMNVSILEQYAREHVVKSLEDHACVQSAIEQARTLRTFLAKQFG